MNTIETSSTEQCPSREKLNRRSACHAWTRLGVWTITPLSKNGPLFHIVSLLIGIAGDERNPLYGISNTKCVHDTEHGFFRK